jgi:hypothetical protein
VEIGFDVLDQNFPERRNESTIAEIAGFLFNFHRIRRSDLCYRFAQRVQENAQMVTAKIRASKAKDIDLFVWKLWLCLPAGETPALATNSHFLAALTERQSQLWEDVKPTLGILGTFNLMGEGSPFAAVPSRLHKTARELCLREANRASYKLIRMCANDLHFSKQDKERIKGALGRIDTALDIPNHEIAIQRLSTRLTS